MYKLLKIIIKNILPYYLYKKYEKYKRQKHFWSDAKVEKTDSTDNLLKVTRTDCMHPFFLRNKTMDLGTYWQIFIAKEYLFKSNKIPNVIIDIGANIGLSAIYFANTFPKTKIIAIEPEKNNFLLLKRNTEKYENIIPLNYALWKTNGEIDVLDTGLGTNAYMTMENIPPNQHHHTSCLENKAITTNKVMAITIDNILADNNLDFIDILKIDIEGAEKEVFENADSWIQKINVIIIELHDRMKSGCSRIFYNKTNGFSEEWTNGENIFLSRDNFAEKIENCNL